MTTIEIKVSSKYKTYLDDTSEYQSMITEVTQDYIELKQDMVTKKSLEKNRYFVSLNNMLEKKLW